MSTRMYFTVGCPECGVKFGITQGVHDKTGPVSCPNSHRLTIPVTSQFRENNYFNKTVCAECTVQFGLSEATYARRKADLASFSCPNGHMLRFANRGSGETTRRAGSEGTSVNVVLKPSPRIGDKDRDTALSTLTAAFAEGKLTDGEWQDRMSLVLAATTQADLKPLLADLPAPKAGRKTPRWPFAATTSIFFVWAAVAIMEVLRVPQDLYDFATIGLASMWLATFLYGTRGGRNGKER